MIRDLLSMIAPAVCPGCGRPLVSGEEVVCMNCLGEMHPMADDSDALTHPLRSRISVRRAPLVTIAPMTRYTHDNVTGRLIRLSKYHNRPEIVRLLARRHGAELARRGLLSDVDVVVPVPMHWFKRLGRGYNQADVIARTIAHEGDCEVADALRLSHAHGSQTRSGASAGRRANVEGSMTLKDADAVAGRHVAIVDDILTTGATLSEAVTRLMEATPRAITVITLGVTE